MMEEKTVRLHSDDGRWLEMTVRGDRATARVGGAEPFPFSFEHLGYAARGMGYQAWGGGSHFNLRHETGGVAVEFQGPGDRGAAVCRLSNDGLRDALAGLGSSTSTGRASLL